MSRNPSEGEPSPFLHPSVTVDENQGSLSATLSLPLPESRAGWKPDLSLNHTDQAISPFGQGWSLSTPSIVRSTADHHPLYEDDPAGDTYQSGSWGELIPDLEASTAGQDHPGDRHPVILIRGSWEVIRYRPIQDAGPVRIERWTDRQSGEHHWRERRSDGMTLIYGKSATHRVVDPEHPNRVWRWLLERRFDPKGNGELYEYKLEDGAGVSPDHPAEAGRLQRGAFSRRYLKRIRYGNSKPVDPVEGTLPEEGRWHFQVVFDYGDHEGPFPRPDASRPWGVRPDPRSEWSAGFDIRTWRLCHRILVYHDMKELGDAPVLTCRYDFRYNDEAQGARSGVQLLEVSRSGVRPGPDGEPVAFPLPPVRFTYTESQPDPEWSELGQDLLPEHRPSDVFGDGVPGWLRQQNGSWYVRRASGPGIYEAEREVPAAPVDARGLAVGDLEGHGRADLVRRSGRGAGHHRLHEDRSGWDSFRPVNQGVATADVMRGGWRDLSGDGRPDRLVEGEGEIWWYGSEGHEGYGSEQRRSLVAGEMSGPPSVTNNPAKGIYLANLSGGGQDVVEVCNGQIHYWPHVGYGRYGHRIRMANAPVFARADEWDRSSLRFVDLNGSGLDDLIYTGEGELRCWLNESGNGWHEVGPLEGVPVIDSHHRIDILDLFGEGTPVLLSTDRLPGRRLEPMRTRRLVGPIRPGRLAAISNGAGLQIEVQYDSSVTDWFRDRAEGHEWHTSSISHRPVVRSLVVRDRVARTVQQQTWHYHDAYRDDREGRFAGFGRVEVRDSGTVAEAAVLEEFRATPTLRRVWFHDGRPDRSGRLHGAWSGDSAVDPPRPSRVSGGASDDAESVVQAQGSLAGRMVREEILEEASDVPLLVREQSWQVDLLQGARDGWRAVSRLRRTSEIVRHYEGQADDPRTIQTLELHPDAHGYSRWSCRYDAPRRVPMDELPEQGVARMRVDRVELVHLDEEPGETGLPRPIRCGIPIGTRTYTGFGLMPEGAEVFDPLELERILELLFGEALPAGSPDPGASDSPSLRLESQDGQFYYDATGAPTQDPVEISIPLREHHNEQLAFTDAMLDTWYGERLQGVDLSGYGYVRRDGDWWAQSSVSLWSGRTGFYLPTGSQDYRGGSSTVAYDDEFRLVVRSVNPMGLETVMEPDFYAMKPAANEDPNGNRVSFLYDGNGRVVATRFHGGEMDESGEVREVGGPVTDWVPPVPMHEWSGLPDLIDRVAADPAAWLGPLTSLHLVDPFGFERDPSEGAVCTAMVMNGAPVGGGEEVSGMVSVHYSDGMGRTLQSKHLDREGDAVEVGSDGELIETDVERRWKSSGGVQLDNKGQPVVQYEPFYSTTHRWESSVGLNRYGLATRYEYDGMGRVTRVESPDGFESRVRHLPWSVTSHDPNDTVRDSFFYKTQVETGLLEGAELATIRKAEEHAETPMQSHLLPGGIPALQEEWIDSQTPLRTRSMPDALGRVRYAEDPRTGDPAVEQVYDLTGRVIWSRSPDSGERRSFFDAEGRPHAHWTAENNCLVTRFDAAWRPLSVEQGALADASGRRVIEQLIYGEAFPDPAEAVDRNLLGHVWIHRDPSGEQACTRYDGRGNLLEKERRLATGWREELDWSESVELEEREFVTRLAWDGLGRETERITPDGTRQHYRYQPSGEIDRLDIQAPGETDVTTLLHGAELDASGRLERVHYGNGVESIRTHDERNGRLKRLVTRHTSDEGADRTLQEMTFYWDPAGNLVRKDDRTREHLLGRLPGSHDEQSRACDYTYDALYRLTHATGWTHLALRGGGQGGGSAPSWTGTRHSSLNDAGELVPYERQYHYDLSGNLTRMRQTGEIAWTREMWVSDHSNRSLPADWVDRTPQVDPESRFDATGNLRELEHLDGELVWGARGELLKATLIQRADQADDADYYRYGHDGMRLRRISERIEHGRSVIRETLWLDGCEIRREHRGDVTVFEQTSLPVEWRGQKVAVLDHIVTDSLNRSSLGEGETRLCYLLCDHRGSVALELDEEAALISYEEYFPYGGTAFMAGSAVRESSRKVYGYNGIEREDATGLCQVGYRSYAPWLFRWISPDPSGPADGLNLYRYLQSSPIQRVDPDGLNSDIARDFEENPDQFKGLGRMYDYTGVRYYDTYEHETHGFVGRYTGQANKEGEFQDVDESQQPWLNEQQLWNLSGINRPESEPSAEERLDELIHQSDAERPEGVDAHGMVDVEAAGLAFEIAVAPLLENPLRLEMDEATESGDEGSDAKETQSAESTDESASLGTCTVGDTPEPTISDRLDRANMPSISQAPEPESRDTTISNEEIVGALEGYQTNYDNAGKAAAVPGSTMDLVSEVYKAQLQEAEIQRTLTEELAENAQTKVDDLRVQQGRFQSELEAFQNESRTASQQYEQARSQADRVANELNEAKARRHHAARLLKNLEDTEGLDDKTFQQMLDRYERARLEAPDNAEIYRLSELDGDAFDDLRTAQRRIGSEDGLRQTNRALAEATSQNQVARSRFEDAGKELQRIRDGIQLKFGDSRTARFIEKAAPAARRVSKVLGPVGFVMTGYNFYKADTAADYTSATLDLSSDVAGLIPHPATMVYSLSYGLTQLADSLTGGKISGGAAAIPYHVDQIRGKALHGAASLFMEDPPEAYEMTLGWQIAGFLENRGIRL